ncbi:MAG: LacI family DNA-binding transcriptional regulator [Candidatus Limnocylindrales bacterium]
MSTISDVAKLAGVSAMTVSRVINNSGYIGRETRSRVEAAVAELAYVPNALGRQLRSKRTKMLALVLTDIMNPFFTTIARGVEDVARGQGFSVVFCNTDESEAEEARYLLMLVQRQVDGVLLVPASTSGKSLRMLSSHTMPVVVLDRRIRSRKADSVRSDSEAGAHTLTKHLIGLGHRRIAMLTGRRSVSTSIDRVAGYRMAMAEAGLEVDDDLVRFGAYNYGDFDQVDGSRMAREVLAADPRPTAIFAANNFIAFGAIRAIREAGLRMPEDMSVVAFDDLPTAWLSDPFLTVVDQPAYEIGRRGAELLLARLDGRIVGPGREVILPSELIIRRSSGPPGVRSAATPDKSPQPVPTASLLPSPGLPAHVADGAARP